MRIFERLQYLLTGLLVVYWHQQVSLNHVKIVTYLLQFFYAAGWLREGFRIV